MLTTPDIAKRWEKRIEGGDDHAAQQSAGSSDHLESGKRNLLTAGTASRRGTRLRLSELSRWGARQREI